MTPERLAELRYWLKEVRDCEGSYFEVKVTAEHVAMLEEAIVDVETLGTLRAVQKCHGCEVETD